MHLNILTPVKALYDDEIDELIIPTVGGEIAILPNHVNLFTKIEPGEMIIKAKGREQYLAITGGFLQIQKNVITVLADYAVRSEEIEADKALAAQKRAEEILKKKEEGVSEQDYAVARSEMTRALLELKISQRRRHARNVQTG